MLLHVRIPVVHSNNSLWSVVDYSRSGHWDVDDVLQSLLDVTVLEDVQDLVGVIDGGVDSIIFHPLAVLVMRCH